MCQVARNITVELQQSGGGELMERKGKETLNNIGKVMESLEKNAMTAKGNKRTKEKCPKECERKILCECKRNERVSGQELS